MATDKDILSDAKEAYRLGIDAERDNRDSYIQDYRFARLDEHWPQDVLTQRQKDGRPALTIPRLPSFIRQVVNDSRQNRPRMKAKPVDSLADPKTAQVIDGLLLNIENASNASVAYDTAVDCSVSGGFGYFRIDIDYSDPLSFDKELRISRIANPLQVVGDPYSQAADSSDWNSAFVTTLLSDDEFGRRYKDGAKANWLDAEYSNLQAPWRDGNEVMIAEWWCREEVDKTLVKLSDNRVMYEDVYEQQAMELMMQGVSPVNQRKTKGYKVKQYLLSGADVLDTVEWRGCYIPIIPVYGEEINIEGKRLFRSLIASAKDSQRRLNYWMSAATEIVALAPKTPYIGEEKAFSADPAKWATINSQSHAYIAVPNGVQVPQRQPLDGGQAVGAISQALAAADDIKSVLGMYDASLGAKSNETSGKAIIARQREGDTATFHFIDNLSRAIQHSGRVLVDLIPYVYTPGMMVRIIGMDGRAATVSVQNRLPGAPPPEHSPLDEGVPPEFQAVYDFGMGRYDVIVDTGPSYTTRREEIATQMVEVIRANPAIFPVIGDKLIKNMDWPEADEIANRLKAMMPQQAQGQLAPEIQKALQEGQKAQAELQALKMDKAMDATKIEAEKFKAETERLEILLPYMTPEMLAQLGLQMNMQAMQTPDVAPSGPVQ